jgi:hypothetical protein
MLWLVALHSPNQHAAFNKHSLLAAPNATIARRARSFAFKCGINRKLRPLLGGDLITSVCGRGLQD